MFLMQASDRNNNGVLEKLEFEELLSKLGVFLTTQELRAVYNHFDTNKDGNISYGEFVIVLRVRKQLPVTDYLNRTTLATLDLQSLSAPSITSLMALQLFQSKLLLINTKLLTTHVSLLGKRKPKPFLTTSLNTFKSTMRTAQSMRRVSSTTT